MKKITILMLILLVFACGKKVNSLEQDYYTITHEIVPLQEDFANKSSAPVYLLNEALENGTYFDVDKAINDIDKVQTDTKKIITEKAKNVTTDMGKKYIKIKMEYIDSVCNFSKNTLTNFKNMQEKSLNSFVKILASDVAISGEKIDSLIREEEILLREFKSMVEK